jgi:hypothetical protein
VLCAACLNIVLARQERAERLLVVADPGPEA